MYYTEYLRCLSAIFTSQKERGGYINILLDINKITIKLNIIFIEL